MPRPTWDTAWPREGIRLRGCHPVPPALPGRSPRPARAARRSRNPGGQVPRFGLLRVRSPLLAQSLLISSPRGTEMFHFPRCRPAGLCVQPAVPPHEGRGVAPFGDPRIKGCLPLPADYRSLPRPSSPRDAKASVVRPYALGRRRPSPVKGAAPRLLALRCNSSIPRHSVFKDQKTTCPPGWWARLESNQGPRPYQGRALTS